jgi:acyl-CoA dehydrogenase
VPLANRVGAENQGWECAKYLLEFERGGGFSCGMSRALFARAIRIGRARIVGNGTALDDPHIADRLAHIKVDLDALEMLEISVLAGLDARKNLGVVSSILKVRSSEIRQAISELTVEILGCEAPRWYEQRPLSHHVFSDADEEERAAALPIYLADRAHTIFAGATEIQLSIIAKSLLRHA